MHIFFNCEQSKGERRGGYLSLLFTREGTILHYKGKPDYKNLIQCQEKKGFRFPSSTKKDPGVIGER